MSVVKKEMRSFKLDILLYTVYNFYLNRFSNIFIVGGLNVKDNSIGSISRIKQDS